MFWPSSTALVRPTALPRRSIGRSDHVRGSALGFQNAPTTSPESLLEAGGFRSPPTPSILKSKHRSPPQQASRSRTPGSGDRTVRARRDLTAPRSAMGKTDVPRLRARPLSKASELGVDDGAAARQGAWFSAATPHIGLRTSRAKNHYDPGTAPMSGVIRDAFAPRIHDTTSSELSTSA